MSNEICFSGADYRVAFSIMDESVDILTMEDIQWREKRTDDPDCDAISGSMTLARFANHPLFGPLNTLIPAETIGQIPRFNITLRGVALKGSTSCTFHDVSVNKIIDAVSCRDLGASCRVSFTARKVEHWKAE